MVPGRFESSGFRAKTFSLICQACARWPAGMLPQAYAIARSSEDQTGLPEPDFPPACPFTLKQFYPRRFFQTPYWMALAVIILHTYRVSYQLSTHP